MKHALLAFSVSLLLVGCSAPRAQVTVPTPAHTLYDAEPESRKAYLAAYQTGYTDYLVGRSSLRLHAESSTDPRLHGYADGALVAMRNSSKATTAKQSDRDTILPKVSSEILPGMTERYGDKMEDGFKFLWHGF